MNPNDRIKSEPRAVEPPPHWAGTHHDDQDERYPALAPEDFPRGVGTGGHVHPDLPPEDTLSADPETNIVPTDSRGG